MPIEGYPLSPQQKRIWLLQQGDPNSPYRVHCNVLIEGNLDLHILKAALAEVWHRHEILRTAFRCPPGSDTPVQIILDEPPPPFTSLDLTNDTHDCTGDRHDPTANNGDLLGHAHGSAGDQLDLSVSNGLDLGVSNRDITAVNHDPLGNSSDQTSKNHDSLSASHDMLGDSLNLTDIDPSHHKALIDEFSEKANRLPFDFALGRLSHLSLVTLSPTRHNLLITLSALCADTASMDILTRAISLAYSTRIHGSERAGKVCYNQYFSAESGCADPAEEPSQYADLAAWQNAILQSENTNPAGDYWRVQKSTPTTSRLPFENQPSAKQNFKPLFLDAAIDPDTLTMIDNAARTYNVSRLSFFSTCWQIVLWYLSRDTDLVAGMICDARTYEGLQEALGPFSKTLPLRCHLTEQLQFCEALHTTSELVREALEWQEYFSWDHFDYPGCGNPGDSNGSPDVPFLAAGFEFQDIAATYPTAGPVLSIQRQHGCSDRFKLKLCCVERNGLMVTELHYDSNLFLEGDIRRLIDLLHTLLKSSAASPDSAIGDLEFLSEAQRRQLLVEFNTTDSGDESRGHLQGEFVATDGRYRGITSAAPPLKLWRDSCEQSSTEAASTAAVVRPRDKCTHQLFEEQVERTPGNIAVVFDHLQLTYLELNGRANQLANHLRILGVRPGVPVALSMERCLEMVVGLLGVLKAGGAYVPIDPHGPTERQAFILEDTRAGVLLTQEHLVKHLPSLVAHTVCLDSEWSSIAQNSETTPMNWATSRDAAYVIYTSGSTGHPKGVIVEHRGLSNAVNWIIETLELSSSDSCFLKTPITFDAAGRELFPVLLSGGALMIVEPEREGDCQHLAETMRRQAISVLHCVPSLLRQLVEEPAFDDALKLRAVMCGGESLAASVVMRFQDRSTAKLYNVYGPTEASIDTAFWPCKPVGVDSSIPIGKPIPNSQIFILDDLLRLLPIGVAGNLHIGGVGLARGYLNRPELTAEKFVPHPFSSAPGARLYETGDVARYLPDGNIEFLGRADQQVKIRGYRIELEEVEAVLARHPEVRHAAVVAQAEASGEQRLVAYVVNEPGRSPTLTELRGFLQGHLPEYMVPAIFIALEALPLTPNGKVDRNALPPLDGARPDLEKGFIAPRDVLELQLTQLWEEVLGVRPVGVRDNFFELGGHSLAAVRLFALIEHRLGRKLPLATVFQGATVEHLATILRERTEHQSSLVAIQPSGDLRPLFLIHPAGGHVFPYVQLARSLGLNQPCYGLQARGLEEGQEPHTQIEDMATHYIEALRTLQPQGPYHIGGWSAGGVVAFEMAQQLLAQGQQVALLALLDARIPGPEEDFADDDFEATLLADFIRYFGLSLDSRESLARLPKDELLSRVLAQAKLAGLVPQDVEASQAHPFIELCKADFRATRNYVPRRYPGRVTLFRAAQELAGMSSDPMLGWSKWAAEGVEVHVVPGNHASMVYKPHVDVLAQMINECLKQVRLSENQLTDSEADDQSETRWLDD
jgi:amino acid adenylation domain-containing protein